ncbi:hypothetical protein J4Q44_G00227490 [Coregonus suidteri]|uniref:Uncharacterized protein n=1 Tax=Coregonus suidteri TaxID=861788 RepID=A0AAN8LPH4_9TELE
MGKVHLHLHPFLPGSQQHWVRQCLKTYPQKPNVRNLDMHMTPTETQDILGKSADVLRKAGSRIREPKRLLEKLRWVTIDYQGHSNCYTSIRQT